MVAVAVAVSMSKHNFPPRLSLYRFQNSIKFGDYPDDEEMVGYISKIEHEALLERERAKARALAEALNWIGAIECAPPNSWPHYLVIARAANEALAAWKEGEK